MVPSHIQRDDFFKKAIHMFKKHFKAVLSSCDTSLPLLEWDQLLGQANLTLNLLRTSQIKPQLSVHAYQF